MTEQAMGATVARMVAGLVSLVRHPSNRRGLTPDEIANLAVSVVRPAVYTASLGGHARLLMDCTAPPERVDWRHRH